MTDLETPSIREKLWHKMRADLVEYVPELAGTRLLMCCCCGRFLLQEDFDLEHLIPQRVLKSDPPSVRANPDTPKNVRAGNLLLCKRPLKINGTVVYPNGCNSWKGRHYDGSMEELLTGTAFTAKARHGNYVGAGLCLGYLAMVAEYGYRVTLMPSGLLMRRQFFRRNGIERRMPVRCQMLLSGSTVAMPADAAIWSRPFSFTFEEGFCTFAARTFSVLLPVTRDPRLPIAKHLRIAPARYKLRPDFGTVFH